MDMYIYIYMKNTYLAYILTMTPNACSAAPAAGDRESLARKGHPNAHGARPVHPTSHILHPTPYTLHPTPYTLHPTPHNRHPTPHTLHPTPHTLHPTPYTLHPTPHAPHPTPYAVKRNANPQALNSAGPQTPEAPSHRRRAPSSTLSSAYWPTRKTPGATPHPKPYRGTSLIRKRHPLDPYRRPIPGALGGSKRAGRFFIGGVPL
jgi:hypothetical protein